MIIFERRKLPCWIGSTPDYNDYNSDIPLDIIFNNTKDMEDFIKEKLPFIKEFNEYAQWSSDRISVVPINGSVIGWFHYALIVEHLQK
jgi:hypothetical protein